MASHSNSEQVAFRVDGKDFCCDVTAVREIRSWSPTVCIPHAPPHVLGVVNLRGTVLPIIDLAAKLGFPAARPTDRHAIVVIEVGDEVLGLLVESVSDIMRNSLEHAQPAPKVAADRARRYLKGIIAIDGRLISWLDIQSLVEDNSEVIDTGAARNVSTPGGPDNWLLDASEIRPAA